jgi:hypothetical protein
MKFSCNFLNEKTDERKSLVVALTTRESESVESLRKHEGSVMADITAQCYALRHAYREIDPHSFHHIEPPQEVRPS